MFCYKGDYFLYDVHSLYKTISIDSLKNLIDYNYIYDFPCHGMSRTKYTKKDLDVIMAYRQPVKLYVTIDGNQIEVSL